MELERILFSTSCICELKKSIAFSQRLLLLSSAETKISSSTLEMLQQTLRIYNLSLELYHLIHLYLSLLCPLRFAHIVVPSSYQALVLFFQLIYFHFPLLLIPPWNPTTPFLVDEQIIYEGDLHQVGKASEERQLEYKAPFSALTGICVLIIQSRTRLCTQLFSHGFLVFPLYFRLYFEFLKTGVWNNHSLYPT